MPTLSALPSTLVAGDSYTLTLAEPSYPASAGWVLSFAIAGASVASWTSVASGDAHVFTLTAIETAALEAGSYQYRLRAIRSGEVDTITTGTIAVQADIGNAAPGELQSYWEQLKAAAEAALTQLMAGGAIQMATIMGRQTMFRSPNDCLRVIALCEQRIAHEQRRGAFGRVSVAFVR